MKKILYSVLAIAMTAFTFTSCEDVPAPYDDPNDNTTNEPIVITPTGDGTQTNPYNVAATIEAASKLGVGEESSETIYMKGIVTNISENYDGGYGNATYYISDDEDGTNKFYIYRSKYFGNTSYSSGTLLEYGDTVVVCGKITNYNGTLETVQNGSYIYSINGKIGEGVESPSEGQPEGDGTAENPYNCVAANAFTSALPADKESDNEIYIKGKVVSISENYGTQFGNATYYISDDGTENNQFYVFRSLYLNNKKYSSGDLLSVGDEVVVCGKVVNFYGNTPETAAGKSYLYSWKKGEGSSTEDVGDPSALNGNFECWIGGLPNNWKTTSSAGNATLKQSTDAHSGSYSVCVGGSSSANKRISYKELTLKAGEYTMVFYVKAATANGASIRPGYAVVGADGSIAGGDSYTYGDYVNNITNTEWVKVTHTFTLKSDGTYCVLIMNAKSPGCDVLIDDFKLLNESTTIIE